ncbi:hypothetical protein [Streptomyces sp. NPDC059575]|uniref:hypothetical protein n=1 Tax=Streptomyces sp. NPDC059575 TaxID=3346872 RepID=UPI0036A354B1
MAAQSLRALDPWPDGYRKQAALVVGLKGCGTYAEAVEAAAVFIGPVLDGTARGVWSPRHATWS